MHAVEKVQRNGEIENCGPYAEAKSLLFQPVVVLWPAAKGRKDPQLKERKKNYLNWYSFCGHTGAAQRVLKFSPHQMKTISLNLKMTGERIGLILNCLHKTL